MEKIIKEFQSIHKCGQIMTVYTFKAIIKPSYFSNYRLKAYTTRFENGEIKSKTQSEMYFKTEKELKNEFRFHYNLNKKSLYTTSITIKK